MSAGVAIAAIAVLSSGAFAADPVTKDEAVAMVKKAVATIKAEGSDKAYAEISNPTGPFVDRDLYIVVYGLDGMDRNYGSRVEARRRPDAAEWAQLRKLGRDAKRLFEIQEAEMRGQAVPRGNGRLLAQQPKKTTLAASVHPSPAAQIAARARGRRQPRP